MITDKPICKKCGKIHVTWQGTPACSAHKKNTNPPEPCTKNPLKALGVCRSHGGATPWAKMAQTKRLAMLSAEGEIGELMRECDIPEQHPIDGLLEVVRVSGSMMRLLTIKVGELAENPEVREVLLENGKTGELSIKRVAGDEAFWGLNHNSEMVPHVYVQLLRTWTERYEKACATALSAGIEERRIRLAEETADTIFSAVSKAAATAGLTPKQMETFTLALARELRTDSSVLELI